MASDHQVALTRVHRGGSTHLNRTAGRVVPAFLQKLYEMVNDPVHDDLIRWSDAGDSFLVMDHERFAREVLPRWFKHQNFSSFVRQLNMYGFHKIPHLQQGVLKSDIDTEYWHFEHPNFHRGQPDLLCLIQRKRQAAQPGEEATADIRDVPTPAGNLSAGQVLDINSIVTGIAAIKRHQSTISADLNELKTSNQHLWQEALTARERHKKHQDTINRILKFLAGVFGHNNAHVHKEDERESPSRAVVPRKPQRLMIGDGRERARDVGGAEVQDEQRQSRSHSARERTPLTSNQFTATIETPVSVPSPSVAPSDIFSPPATDASPMLTPINPSVPTHLLNSTSSSNNGTLQTPRETNTSSGPSANGLSSHSAEYPNPSTSTSLTATSPPQNSDAVLQSAFAQMLQSPVQMQRLLAALSSAQPSYSMAEPPLPEAPDPRALAQLTPFDPLYDYTSQGYDAEQVNPAFVSHSSVPLLSPPEPKTDVASLDPLIDNAARLQKTYKDASEIDADVNSLHTSINSLIESLGLDPNSIAPSNPQALEAQQHSDDRSAGGNRSGDMVIDINDGEPTSAPDFDFDAFLTEFSREGDQNPDYGEFADKLESARVPVSSPGNDASLSAFLDEVTSQSDSTAASPIVSLDSPDLQPMRGGSRKRKSDVADLGEDPITGIKDNSHHIGTKAKRKR